MRLASCLLLFVLASLGCSDQSEKFLVTNHRDSTLKNVKVSNGRHDFIIPSLPPQRTHVEFLSFEDMPRVDGIHLLQIDNRVDSLNYVMFGYYSNGSSIYKQIDLVIYNDSLGAKFDFKEY